MAANNAGDMNSAMEQLTQVQHKAAEALYKQTGAGGAESATGPEDPSGPQDDVIDAEVVDEEKK